MSKKGYSSEEKKAYFFGVGVGIGRGGQIKSTMDSIPAHLKESFKNGLDRGVTNPKKPVFKNKPEGKKMPPRGWGFESPRW